MLDLLKGKFGLLWPKLSWKLFYWLSNPKLITLALLVFATVMLLAIGPRYRQQMITASLALLCTYWVITSPLFAFPATQLLTSFVPPDTGDSADAIVVLARSSFIQGDRYNTALDMIESGRANKLLIMGGYQGQKVFQGLVERNLAPEVLMSAVCVRTTKQEAEAAAAALGSRGLNNVILITDAPHMLRAWLTFKGLGFTVIPRIEPLPSWVSHRNRSFLAMREYLGLVSYGVLGRFQAAPSSDLVQLASDLADEFPPDQCSMTAAQIRQSLWNS